MKTCDKHEPCTRLKAYLRNRRGRSCRGVMVGEIEEHPRGVKYVYFSDPDGNSWALQEMPWRSQEFFD